MFGKKKQARLKSGILGMGHIDYCVKNNLIAITPYDPEKLVPYGYQICMPEELVVYSRVDKFDMKSDNKEFRETIKIPKEGQMLRPGNLYLAIPDTEFGCLYPNTYASIYGLEQNEKLGIFVHKDFPSASSAVLPITVVYPTIVYVGMPIATISFVINEY